MGASNSVPAQANDTVTISKHVIEDHLQKYKDLEAKHAASEILISDLISKNRAANFKLTEERQRNQRLNRELNIKIAHLEHKLGILEFKELNLKSERSALKDKVSELTEENGALKTQLETQEVYMQETLDGLSDKIRDIEQKLAQETRRSEQAMKTLEKERSRNKISKQDLQKHASDVKMQRDELDEELTQLKTSKLFVTLEGLTKLTARADETTNKILAHVKSNNRQSYQRRFQEVKAENDAKIKGLKSVNFAMRLYETHHDDLLKLQEKNDKSCVDIMKTIHSITKDCKILLEEYNSTFPERFIKAIDDRNKDLDALETVDHSPLYADEEQIQTKILNALQQEKTALEAIATMEKTSEDKVVNKLDLTYTNNFKESYDLVVYNMPEANDDYQDILAFEAFMLEVTGRKIPCEKVQRFGQRGNTPRPARITLESRKDWQDLLEGKLTHLERYAKIRVAKHEPYWRRTKDNVDR